MHRSCLFQLVALITLLMLPAFNPLPAQDQTAPAAPDPNAFFFHDGDSPIVFLGDSVTEQRMYTTLIETYILTRFPNWNVTFRNAGWGGDTSWLQERGDFDAALQRDVLSLKPKAVTIDYGMNDARGGDATLSKYTESITRLVKKLELNGARVALITSSPEEGYEMTGAPAGSTYNLMLKKYAGGLKLVADNESVPYIDQYTPFVAAIEAGRKANVLSRAGTPLGSITARLTNDGVHPNWGGHLIMATAILQAMHAPAVVSSISLDATARSITASSACTVEWQDSPAGTVQFKRTDDAMPWPIPNDPTIDTALKIPGFDPATALNQYMLQITGLKAVSYRLSINGQAVGVYKAADLAKGINLCSLHQGPIFDQGQRLLETVIAKNNDYFERWRHVQLGVYPDWMKKYPAISQAVTTETTRLDKQIISEEAAIEDLRRPNPYIFRLDPN